MFKLSQETIAILTVGLALAGLVTTAHLTLRAEMRADRAEARAEARADREAFSRQILRLTQEQSKLSGIVEQMRTASR